MGADTIGKIKGFIRHEDVFNYIKQKYDKNATDEVVKKVVCPISECDWEYQLNEHSEDANNWYMISGFINFQYNEEQRMLFYTYNNLNSFENMDYYSKHGLTNMVKSETTYLSLGYWGSSIDIIRELVTHFGGGWIDNNDCDDETYYLVEPKVDETLRKERENDDGPVLSSFVDSKVLVETLMEKWKPNMKFNDLLELIQTVPKCSLEDIKIMVGI